MKLEEIVGTLELEVVASTDIPDIEVCGAYASDLISDVIANAAEGDIWITLQTHHNIVAVASMKGLAGIIFVNGRRPDEDTVARAEQEKVVLMVSRLGTFEVSGRLYQAGVRGSRR